MFFSPEQIQSLESQTFAHLLVAQDGPVLRLTLNRPEAKNALNEVLLRELAFALSYAQHQPGVWLVVLAAAGDVFCAGMDLKAMNGPSDGSPSTSTVPLPPGGGPIRLGELMAGLTKPSIALIQGSVYAGGFLLVAGCTWAIAGQHARFGLPEVRRGLFPFQVMDSLLTLGLPPRRVLDWCLRGQTLSATEALEAGLLSEICPAEALDAQVQALTQELLALAPLALQRGLAAFRQLPGLPEGQRQAFLFGQFGQIQQTADAREGLTAFAEKRPPQFKGQ